MKSNSGEKCNESRTDPMLTFQLIEVIIHCFRGNFDDVINPLVI